MSGAADSRYESTEPDVTRGSAVQEPVGFNCLTERYSALVRNLRVALGWRFGLRGSQGWNPVDLAVEPPYQLRLIRLGRETAVLLRGGRGGYSTKRAFILHYTHQLSPYYCMAIITDADNPYTGIIEMGRLVHKKQFWW
jgi:hypothetical protein